MENTFQNDQLVCAKKYPSKGGTFYAFGYVRRVAEFGISVVWLGRSVIDFGLHGAESEYIGNEEIDELEIVPATGDGEIFLSEVAP